MDKINYLELIKKSLSITWKNKYLWWFGLFLSLGSGLVFNFNIPGRGDWSKQPGIEGKITDFFARYWGFVLAGIILLVILGIAFFIFRLISQAGIIKTLSKIDKNEKGNFREGFREGKRYFWKLLGLNLIIGFLTAGIFIILFVPVMFLFYLGSWVFGIVALMLAILIFVPLIILASFLGKYACFYIILSDLKILPSIEKSYQIFRGNIFPSIIMALIFIPVSIILSLAILISLVLIGIIFLIPGIIFYLVLSYSGVYFILAIVLLVILILILLAGSVYQVFYQATWFLFFKEIASVKEDPIAETEKEKEVAEKIIPSPEEA
ncbi:MAG: hypothetical protein Q7S18_00795 [bacterium]|nr:hypothetical protein [bacterium]